MKEIGFRFLEGNQISETVIKLARRNGDYLRQTASVHNNEIEEHFLHSFT